MSLKWKIQLWHAFILMVVLGTLGTGFYHYEKTHRITKIDEQLDSHVHPLLGPFNDFTPRRPGGPGREHPPRGERPPRGEYPPREGHPPREAEAFVGEERSGKPEGGWDRRTMASNPEGRTRAEMAPPPGLAGPHFRFENNAVSSGYYGRAGRKDGSREPYVSSNYPGVEFPAGLEPGFYSREREGRYRELFHEQGGKQVLVGFDLHLLQDDLDRLKLQILGGLLAIFVFAMIVGHFLVSRSIKPLGAIEKTSAKIAKGELSERIPEISPKGATELKALSKNLNETFAQLEDSFQRQIRFTADASHELRTPLTALLAQIEHGLKRSRTEQEHEDILKVCKRSSKRICCITEQLIELSRYDSGRVEMDLEEVSLEPMLISLAEELDPYVRERGHDFQLEISGGEFVCDPFRLEQVLTNLINNAIQHNDEAMTITLRARLVEEDCVIEVIDTGKGIQPENLDKLFGRFFQESSSRNKGNGRTNVGLGLSISEAIVKAHGGRIEVTSEPRVQTVFRIILPCRHS